MFKFEGGERGIAIVLRDAPLAILHFCNGIFLFLLWVRKAYIHPKVEDNLEDFSMNLTAEQSCWM